jgi:hypothetical protein
VEGQEIIPVIKDHNFKKKSIEVVGKRVQHYDLNMPRVKC